MKKTVLVILVSLPVVLCVPDANEKIDAAKESESKELYCDRLVEGIRQSKLKEMVGYWTTGSVYVMYNVLDNGNVKVFNVHEDPVSPYPDNSIRIANSYVIWTVFEWDNASGKYASHEVYPKALRCQTWVDDQAISLNFFADDRMKSIGLGRKPGMLVASDISTPAQEHVVDHCVVLLFPSLKTKECPLKVYEY